MFKADCLFIYIYLYLYPLLFVMVPHLHAKIATDKFAPEAATGHYKKAKTVASHYMAVTANPYASKAAAVILKQGGSAVDAAIAAQLVLGLVEPQSSGIGGGGFMLYFEAKARKLMAYDGRETAPLKVNPYYFLEKSGKPKDFFDAVVGAYSVGTPGLLKMLFDAHLEHGKLAFKGLLRPAIELAEKGFKIGHRLHGLIKMDQVRIKTQPVLASYLLDQNGNPKKVGDTLKNQAYADTLKVIQQKGVEAFYQGEIAKRMVTAVQNHPTKPGLLSLADLASYRSKVRNVLCQPYKSYKICGMPPPSSGGITIAMALGMLEGLNLEKLGPKDPQAWFLIGEASRLAFADRGTYLGDPDFFPVPMRGLLDATYLKARAQTIKLDPPGVIQKVDPGKPTYTFGTLPLPTKAIELPSTTHLSIVDRKGNVVSMTSSVENVFGSRVMVDGYILNNQLTDFSFKPVVNEIPAANRIAPGKRPLSSMSPTIVLNEKGEFYLAIGSPGGSRIIGYVLKALISHLDWGLEVQESIRNPNLLNRFGTFELESGGWAEKLEKPLQKLGYKTKVRDLNSGQHAIIKKNGTYVGAADWRREGLAIGE